MSVVTIIIVLIFFAVSLSAVKFSKDNNNLIHKELKFSKLDLYICLGLTAITTIISFWHLGNTKSIESFYKTTIDSSVTVKNTSQVPVAYMMIFQGQGSGDHTIVEINADGYEVCRQDITHSHADNMVWKRVDLAGDQVGATYYIASDGNNYLGEVALIDENDLVLDIECSEALLSDEQDKVCTENTYMNSTYFDEIYYARTAWELNEGIYPYECTHPPLGKNFINICINIWGLTPFGWRFAGVLFGVLLIPLMYAFAKCLFKNTFVASVTTILLVADSMRYAQSRICTIDTFAVFFSLGMFLFMYLFVLTDEVKYLIICGIVFGLGVSTKWTCCYTGAGLAVVWIAYWIINRKKGFKAFAINSGLCILAFIVAPLLIYYLTYIPYGRTMDIYNPFCKEFFMMVVDNCKYMYNYHSHLDATHPYQSVWYQWILDIRPILYYANYPTNDSRIVIACLLNPVIAWAGILSILVTGICVIVNRSREGAIILAGYLANLLPWIFIERCAFEYHYFTSAMFLILAIGYCFNMIKDNKYKRIAIYVLACMTVILFVVLFPVSAGVEMSDTYRKVFLQFMSTWPF